MNEAASQQPTHGVERVDVVRIASRLNGRASRRTVLVHVLPVHLDSEFHESVHVGRHHVSRRIVVAEAVPAAVRPAVVVLHRAAADRSAGQQQTAARKISGTMRGCLACIPSGSWRYAACARRLVRCASPCRTSRRSTAARRAARGVAARKRSGRASPWRPTTVWSPPSPLSVLPTEA